jgi:exopolysaccharide production protein ExoY
MMSRQQNTANSADTAAVFAGVPELDTASPGVSGQIPDRPDYPAKPVVDRTLAVIALAVLAPLLGMIAAAIYFSDPGKVFFSQWRLGRDGHKFRCIKFRSMVNDGDVVLQRHLRENPEAREEWEATRKLRDDPRVTRIGLILRKSSLDELPQLINIARGEMSIVGPRPIVEDEAPYYGGELAYYKAVRPGLTGLWQVSGRNDVSYDERVRLDTHYVRNVNFRSDFEIVCRTVRVVALGHGSY